MEIIEIIKERLSVFTNLYDTIRIVDPINKRVLHYKEDKIEMIMDPCCEFGVEGCNNCTSMRAYLEHDTFLKMEVSGGKVFLIISSPVTIENKVYIVEMIKDISQANIVNNEKNTDNNEKNLDNIKNLIKEMNDAAKSCNG